MKNIDFNNCLDYGVSFPYDGKPHIARITFYSRKTKFMEVFNNLTVDRLDVSDAERASLVMRDKIGRHLFNSFVSI